MYLPQITIFTPTYNREYTLPKLYKSLLEQTCTDFIWLIVDDGSTDNTKKLVESFIRNSLFKIIYIYKSNGGKYSAHNLAVLNADTKLFYTVDSDDYLPHDAVENIIGTWNKVDKEGIAGIIGLKAYSNQDIIGNLFPENLKKSKLLDLYRLHSKTGDTSLVFLTEVLKKTPYPVFPGEKMIPDSYIYAIINRSYDMYVTNTTLCYCEYLQDGLTVNGVKNALNSPKGYATHKKLMMECEPKLKWRLKSMVGYVMYSVLANEIADPIKDLGVSKFIFCMPFSLGMYLRLKIFELIQQRKR